MINKVKLAIVALLGFSTACSSVKNTAKSKEDKTPSEEVTPAIKVMYGVPSPRPVEPSKKEPAPVTEETVKVDNIIEVNSVGEK